jgi:predicted GTPase
MIDFENKKMLIRSDQTESARGKNVVIDDSAPTRIIMPKNAEVGLQKVDERKRKSDPRPKPTVKQLLYKYTSHKANNVFSQFGGTKLSRSPSRPGGA